MSDAELLHCLNYKVSAMGKLRMVPDVQCKGHPLAQPAGGKNVKTVQLRDESTALKKCQVCSVQRHLMCVSAPVHHDNMTVQSLRRDAVTVHARCGYTVTRMNLLLWSTSNCTRCPDAVAANGKACRQAVDFTAVTRRRQGETYLHDLCTGMHLQFGQAPSCKAMSQWSTQWPSMHRSCAQRVHSRLIYCMLEVLLPKHMPVFEILLLLLA